MARPIGEILPAWLERDLSAAAEAGELPRAHGVDDQVERVGDVIASGRHPILRGEPGVGKTAIVYELVRRAAAGEGPRELLGKRVVQLSLRKRLSAARKKEELGPAMNELVDALLAARDIVPFFRDAHLAYHLDLEAQLEVLGMRATSPILCEGEGATIASMLEGTPALEQYYVSLFVDEPETTVVRGVLRAWADEQARGPIDDAAIDEGIELTHRFLSRSRHPRKSLELVSQVRSLVGEGRPVGAADIIDRFQRAHRVPRMLIDPSVPCDVEALEKDFAARVLGQPQAVRAVVRMVAAVKAGLSDPRRPFGALLFVGPTGVGKTHLAQLLAEHLFGSRDRMLRFNMADYPNPNDAFTLFGLPNAYSPAQRRGVLATRLSGHPFAVVLLDEFEKAHAAVHDRFLQLVDEGAFINGGGETVSCRSLILIATSNAGAEVYRQRAIGFREPSDPEELERELERRLLVHFRLEFLNRFDQVVHFRPLGREEIRAIALREVEALGERSGLKRRGLVLEIDEAVLDWLAAHGHDPLFGARFLRRAVERNATTAIAELVVRVAPPDGSRIALGVRGGRLAASLVGSGSEPRPSVVRPVGRALRAEKLDRAELGRAIEALLARAAPRLQALDDSRREASALVGEMARDGFWTDGESARETLARHRTLDVAVQIGARLAEPIAWLSDLAALAATQPRRLPELARAYERAADALLAWEEREAAEGPSSVWLLVRDADPLHGGAAWLADVVEMELGWCKHLDLSAEVVAVGLSDGQLARAVLDVDGPGAAAMLALEHGLHRLRASDGDKRVRIDVVPKTPPPREPRACHAVKRATGPLRLPLTATTVLRWPALGVALELSGHDTSTLGHAAADLEPLLDPASSEPDLARVYADQGAGARDPRTGAVVGRYRDAMKGKLDPLLEAWREHVASRDA